MPGHDESEISNNILKTKDSFGHSSTCDQLLHQFMHHASGHVTRAVDLAFGVVDPTMQDRYRAVFENSPDFVKMSTVDRELISLRAYLCNVQTEFPCGP